MAKRGFRVMDSDIHCVEPPDLWLRYLEPAFRAQAPQPPPPGSGLAGPFYVLDRPIARLDLPERQASIAVRGRRARQRFAQLGRTDGAGDGTSPRAMLTAMDTEGIDLAVVFRSAAAHVIARDDLPPPFAAAICRAYNRWLRDFCDADRTRLLPAALLALHDVDSAVAE